nr:MAG TPA: hypothetical protein [Bacteriophage sp.]
MGSIHCIRYRGHSYPYNNFLPGINPRLIQTKGLPHNRPFRVGILLRPYFAFSGLAYRPFKIGF